MKTKRVIIAMAVYCSCTLLPKPGWAAGVYVPERFGVIDITPFDEASQNSEPSLAVGVNANYGQAVVHAFTFGTQNHNDYYTTPNLEPPWTSSGTVVDHDATLDWSAGGTCYLATIPAISQMSVLTSLDPVATPFSSIVSAAITKVGCDPEGPCLKAGPDQPWIRVVNVDADAHVNATHDHIFVGYNDLTQLSRCKCNNGKTATVRYSLDGGATWNETVLEKVATTIGEDSPAVRLAIGADGKTVYALFQRWTTDSGIDYEGDVVLTRDDGSGGTGFGALGQSGAGTKVATGVVLPAIGGTSLGAQRLGCNCDVAIYPTTPATVYVAYTEIYGSLPVIRISRSTDSGATFNLVYTIPSASLPSLAVTRDGTFGVLYAAKNGTDLEVHFLKAYLGIFTLGTITDRLLAKFPNNNPLTQGDPYLGDYFQLRAVNYDFFGTFSASGDPQPSHFPSGVFFQRGVKVGGLIKHNSWLPGPGELVDSAGAHVDPSIDPFVFYDYAPTYLKLKILDGNSASAVQFPHDPYSGVGHLSWPKLPATEPPFQLYTSATLGADASWTLATNNAIIQTNGENLAALIGTQGQQFYRLRQDAASGQFGLFAAAGANGSLNPSGILTNAGLTSQTFTATPNDNYAVSKWYLDGVQVQSNGVSLTVSNINTEHSVVVTFAASNDLAVTVFRTSTDEGPTEIGSTNTYKIEIENRGLNALTGISMSNVLDSTVGFVSASASQGSVNYSGGLVTADFGSLDPNAVATITIQFIPFVATNIVDAVSVGCAQFEPDLSNNFAVDYTTVIDPVIITNQPASVNAPIGGGADFCVAATGTPPFTYQWFYNTTNLINNATNACLSLTNLTTTNSGTYSVSVLQILGPESIEGTRSIPATLLVQ